MNTDKWQSKYYKKHSIPQELCALDAIQNHAFHGDEQVLDLGCGDGRITAEIAKRVSHGKAIGIDASANMIEAAQKINKKINNLNFEQADATQYHPEIQFDLIVGFSALHWMSDQLAIFQNIYSLLKIGGKVLIRTAGGESSQIKEIFLKDYWIKKFSKKRGKFQAKTADEYAAMLHQCGFKNIQARTLQASTDYESSEQLLQWLMAWVPYATGLLKGQDLEFAQNIVANIYSHQHKSLDESIEVLTPLAHLEATK